MSAVVRAALDSIGQAELERGFAARRNDALFDGAGHHKFVLAELLVVVVELQSIRPLGQRLQDQFRFGLIQDSFLLQTIVETAKTLVLQLRLLGRCRCIGERHQLRA